MFLRFVRSVGGATKPAFGSARDEREKDARDEGADGGWLFFCGDAVAGCGSTPYDGTGLESSDSELNSCGEALPDRASAAGEALQCSNSSAAETLGKFNENGPVFESDCSSLAVTVCAPGASYTTLPSGRRSF